MTFSPFVRWSLTDDGNGDVLLNDDDDGDGDCDNCSPILACVCVLINNHEYPI